MIMKAKEIDISNNKKVCLIGAGFESKNMGVGALAAGTIKSILNAYPQAHISLLDYGRESINYEFLIDGTKVPIRLVNMRFSKKIFLKNNIAILLLLAIILNIIKSKYIRSWVLRNNRCLQHVEEADLIVSIAGGDSFSDIYGIRNFLYVALPQILILLMGKNLILMPQTLGPYKSRLTRGIATYIMNRAIRVYSRDYVSFEEIKAMRGLKNSKGHVKFCYDVGFILDPVKPANIDIVGLRKQVRSSRCLVGFNISGLLYMRGYTRNNMFGFKLDYCNLVYKIIDYLIKEKQAVLMLVPHVFGSEEHAESDSTVCQKIYDDLKNRYGDNLALVKGTYNQNEIKYIIGLCDFFIGSRMHACIAAVSQNIPAVAIAYSRKFKGLMDTVEVGGYVADPREMDEQQILTMIGKAYDDRSIIKNTLAAKMPSVKDQVMKLFKEIEEDLNMYHAI